MKWEMGRNCSILKLTKRITPERVVPAKITFDKSKFKAEYPDLYDELVVVEEAQLKEILQ